MLQDAKILNKYLKV